MTRYVDLIEKRMPVILVTMKLLNGLFRKAEATPCCITESAFDKVHMHSGKGIGNRWNDLLELVVMDLNKQVKIVHQTYRKGRKHYSITLGTMEKEINNQLKECI